MATAITPLFSDVRRQRDVVLVDQRGTGESNRLNCKFYEDEDAIADPPAATEADVRKRLDSLGGDPLIALAMGSEGSADEMGRRVFGGVVARDGSRLPTSGRPTDAIGEVSDQPLAR